MQRNLGSNNNKIFLFVSNLNFTHRFHSHLPSWMPGSREIDGIAQNGPDRVAGTCSKSKRIDHTL